MDFTEVKERVSQLEGAIKRLDSVRKHLSRNALDIKSEIHANVSRNLECLRGREVSLLGAVDQVLAVKEDTLQGQQARLNQALGVLHTSLSMVGTADADRQQITETLDRLNKVELSPEETPYISFRADHLGLREAILSYGRVDANGLPLVTAFEDPSKPSASLPRHFEEYEDVDHHVFYKTLGHSQAGRVPGTSINVTIPKLSTRVEDWLQKKVVPTPPASEGSCRAARPSTLPQRVRSEAGPAASTPGSSCSLNNWLSLIKQHADLEEEHDFEITDNTASLFDMRSTPVSAKSSPAQHLRAKPLDSSVWLHKQAKNHGKPSSNVFKHIPSDPKVWLVQAYNQMKKLTVASNKETSSDLFAHISKDSATWLIRGAPAKTGSCCVSASGQKTLRQRENTSQASGINARSNLFSHISSKTDDWLHKETKSHNPTGNSLAQAPNASDTRKWLVQDKDATAAPAQPRVPAIELEDVCRANELCCSMTECVSKPDCVAMFLCSEGVTPSKPALASTSSPARDKNNRSTTGFDFQQWASTSLEDWLAPATTTAPFVVAPNKISLEEKLGKLSLDMQTGEKVEAKEVEADSCDMFHLIPGLSDPVWRSSTSEKGVKEEENNWLQKSPQQLSNADAQFEEWLVQAKAGLGDDSEGWSVVSESFSVHSEQKAMDVATADSYINKWLL